jgi:uncharacterized protein DUF3309
MQKASSEKRQDTSYKANGHFNIRIIGAWRHAARGATNMSLGTILLIILILALIGAIPNWGYSSGWGYGPSGLVGTVLVVVLILVLLGRI